MSPYSLNAPNTLTIALINVFTIATNKYKNIAIAIIVVYFFHQIYY